MHQIDVFFRWLSLVLTTLALCACSVLAPSPQTPLDLTIVHTGKVYGEIFACGG